MQLHLRQHELTGAGADHAPGVIVLTRRLGRPVGSWIGARPSRSPAQLNHLRGPSVAPRRYSTHASGPSASSRRRSSRSIGRRPSESTLRWLLDQIKACQWQVPTTANENDARRPQRSRASSRSASAKNGARQHPQPFEPSARASTRGSLPPRRDP
jgi:HEAT repeat protein